MGFPFTVLIFLMRKQVKYEKRFLVINSKQAHAGNAAKPTMVANMMESIMMIGPSPVREIWINVTA